MCLSGGIEHGTLQLTGSNLSVQAYALNRTDTVKVGYEGATEDAKRCGQRSGIERQIYLLALLNGEESYREACVKKRNLH